jgi:hypothetical protein
VGCAIGFGLVVHVRDRCDAAADISLWIKGLHDIKSALWG